MSEITRRTLADQVADRLFEYIEEARLAPGERLPAEGRLAERYGVSRPVIRQAMRSLQARGVTETANGKSAVIRPLDSKNLQFYFAWGSRLRPSALIELMEVRRGIEMEAASLAATRHTKAQGDEIRRLVEDMGRNLPDPVAYAELDVRFHLAVARASHNETLHLLVDSLRSVLRDSIVEGLKARRNSDETATVQRLHEDIVKEVLAGDSDAAMRAMMRHFDDAVTAMVRDGHTAELTFSTDGGK